MGSIPPAKSGAVTAPIAITATAQRSSSSNEKFLRVVLGPDWCVSIAAPVGASVCSEHGGCHPETLPGLMSSRLDKEKTSMKQMQNVSDPMRVPGAALTTQQVKALLE